MYYATMTAVRDGIEFSKEIEDETQSTFYARVVGMVQGAIVAGHQVTNLETREV